MTTGPWWLCTQYRSLPGQHPELDHVKFILPTAPMIPVTAMQGRVVPSWYDCYSLDDHATRKEDETGLYQSVKWIHDLINKEEQEHSIPSNRIFIGGFSQGGSVAILTALTTQKPLGGLFALSTYIPLRKKTSQDATEFAKEIPIFWGHGTDDRQVDFTVWKDLAEVFAGQLGIPFISPDLMSGREVKENGTAGLRFYSYEGLGHWIDEKALADLAIWISILVPSEVPLEVAP